MSLCLFKNYAMTLHQCLSVNWVLKDQSGLLKLNSPGTECSAAMGMTFSRQRERNSGTGNTGVSSVALHGGNYVSSSQSLCTAPCFQAVNVKGGIGVSIFLCCPISPLAIRGARHTVRAHCTLPKDKWLSLCTLSSSWRCSILPKAVTPSGSARQRSAWPWLDPTWNSLAPQQPTDFQKVTLALYFRESN